MDISFEHDIAEWTRSMTLIQRDQVPFATVVALTRTAGEVKAVQRNMLPGIFDRPTRWTLNSLMVTPAMKGRPVASVWFKQTNRAGRHYLLPNIEGGPRPHKAFERWLIRQGAMRSDEYAVPGRGLRLDAYGNVSAGTVTQILSQLAATPDANQWETARSRKRAGPSRSRYFVPKPGSLVRGIWRRTAKGVVEPVFLFVTSVSYQARYQFHDIAEREAAQRFPRIFEQALDQAIRNAPHVRGRSGSRWTR